VHPATEFDVNAFKQRMKDNKVSATEYVDYDNSDSAKAEEQAPTIITKFKAAASPAWCSSPSADDDRTHESCDDPAYSPSGLTGLGTTTGTATGAAPTSPKWPTPSAPESCHRCTKDRG
jgi:hypothetical protein